MRDERAAKEVGCVALARACADAFVDADGIPRRIGDMFLATHAKFVDEIYLKYC